VVGREGWEPSTATFNGFSDLAALRYALV